MAMKEQSPIIYKEFSLTRGGLLFRLLVHMRLMKPDLAPLYSRAIVLALLTWLPLLVLSAMQGLALGGSIKIPFLYDLTVSVRLLLALPLLIVAERVVDFRSNEVIRHFIESGLVDDKDVPKYESIVRQIMRMVNSLPVEGAIVGLVILNTVFFRLEFSEISSTWQFLVSPAGMTRTPAGWWHLVVSIPVFQFLLWRWLYRYLVWCWFLWRVSRLDLRLISTHPDRVGGLAFLGVLQVKFCPIIFALASVLSAYVGQEVLLGGAALQQYTMMILGNVALILFIFLGPYLVFSLKLFEAKRRGFLAYSTLANDYTQSFQRKWIRGEAPEGEVLLGSSDIQSLADLSNSFAIVRDMRMVPFDLKLTILPIVSCTVIPFFPLLLTVFPLDEILAKIVSILL
jgi:hypothetical protein